MDYFTLTLKFVSCTLARGVVIFSHLFLGNRISSLLIEKYTVIAKLEHGSIVKLLTKNTIM